MLAHIKFYFILKEVEVLSLKPFSLFSLVFVFFLIGCDTTHIHEPGKVKSLAQSNKVVLNRNEFVLCTSTKTNTAVRRVEEEAKKECARFGKYAQKKKTTIATCPLTTPVSWHYQCVQPETVDN